MASNIMNQSVIDNEREVTSVTYEVLCVNSLEEVQQEIREHELEKSTKYITVKKDKMFGKEDIDLHNSEVRFEDTQKTTVPYIPADGVPFIIVGRKRMACHQGKDTHHKDKKRRKGNDNQIADHDYKKTRKLLQPTKKKNCMAGIRVRHVLKFPDYKLSENGKRSEKDAISLAIKHRIATGKPLQKQQAFFISIPNDEEHQNHFMGEDASLIQPIDTRLKQYIGLMVGQHQVSNTFQMKLLLEVYVKQTLFHGQPIPSRLNTRFWPSIKDIKNHMALALLRLRNTNVDQAVVLEMVKKWEKEYPNDNFFIKVKEDNEEELNHGWYIMASSRTHFCTLCQEDDITTKAVSWCLECKDWLCTDCQQHHERSKIAKQHKTVTLAVYETLPPHILKIRNMCNEHHFKCDRFCSFHGTPCCILCVREAHNECELSRLVDVLQNVKESAAVFHLETDLNEIQKDIQFVEKHLLERITKVHDQKKHCLNKINRVRRSVNEHLDTIEKHILDELSQKEKDIKKTMESLASQIESKKRRVVNLQDSLLNTKHYATDLQLFLSIKEMEKQTSEDTKYLEDLETVDTMTDKSLELEVSPALQSLQRDIVTFGRISVKSVPSTLKLTKTSQGQAQLSLPVVSTLDKDSLVKPLTINISQDQSVVSF